ncbi:hypothetical protein [Persicobacter psychrovividus]|uniref:Uncharacterized protein n=1 Tax=Persicobacter psychrovividus TaxID=387638 RepID=A0ABM7VE49_9BACT|nr:hypothetical protein PEPS_15230 [Persicobacter psychrovividus]
MPTQRPSNKKISPKDALLYFLIYTASIYSYFYFIRAYRFLDLKDWTVVEGVTVRRSNGHSKRSLKTSALYQVGSTVYERNSIGLMVENTELWIVANRLTPRATIVFRKSEMSKSEVLKFAKSFHFGFFDCFRSLGWADYSGYRKKNGEESFIDYPTDFSIKQFEKWKSRREKEIWDAGFNPHYKQWWILEQNYPDSTLFKREAI